MVIGNGMIANRFMNRYRDDSNVIIFASGVSNSSEKFEDQYIREKVLIEKYLNEYSDKKFVYFSSFIHLSGMKSRYLDHKREIETLLQKLSNNYLVIRLPQIFGHGGNKNNIINYFDNCIKCDIPINVQIDTVRSIIDIDDVFNIVTKCIDCEYNKLLNLSYVEQIYVDNIVKFLYHINNKTVKIIYQPKGYSITTQNSPIINDIIKELEIETSSYTHKVLIKYIKV